MTNMDCTIEDRLRAYLVEKHLPRNSGIILDDSEDLFSTGVIDSGGVLVFVEFIEDHFGLAVPDEDLIPGNFKSIEAIAAYIRSKKSTAQ
jgi:acyl carrier protein